jgi:hypothetical protein
MDVKATYTKHYIPRVEHPNLLATQSFPPGWNFSSGALFPNVLFRSQLIYPPGEGGCAESFTWIVGCWDRYMGLGAFTEDAWPELCACHGEWSTPSSLYLIRDVCQFFLSLTSFFHALSLSRSMSNSLETTLTTIALSYYPWDSSILPSRYAG